MAKQASIVCLKCGKAITQPVKYCPYCAAALPGTEEGEEAAQEQEHGYWDFYGAAPEGEAPQEGPVGVRGWLRFIALCVFVASCALGMALNGWSWGFRWTRAAIIWAVGIGVAIILFVISFFFKKVD